MHISLHMPVAAASLLISCATPAHAMRQEVPETSTPTDASKPSDQEVPRVTETQDTEALFRQVFGTERPAPAAGEYSVLVDDINVGDYRITPGKSTEGSIDASLVRNALSPIALPELATKLKAISQKPIVQFEELRAVGLEVAFDPGQLVL